ncbi:MAG: MBL fold metallo-hydrolase [Sulfuricaulis sp.]|nr:MBL fold metallo-hydrolase [Sulfuricaulis sp.]
MANLMWQVGDITITKVVEMEMAHPNGGEKSGLPDAWPEAIKQIPWLIPDFATEEGHLRMGVHALLVQTPDTRVIVDTCVGNDKTRAFARWNKLTSNFLERLEDAGWPRGSVDGVLCTHLHVDHVGWNTMLENGRWVATFPNAKYYMARRELAHWSDEIERTTARAADSQFRKDMMDLQATYLDSVKPIVDAGLATLVETDAQIAPGIRLIPTPGHTPGHVSVVIESKGERAIITGDMMHHPCQIARPQWSSAFDTDRNASCETRKAFFAEFADTQTLIIGTHFGGPTAGWLVRAGGEYRLHV